MKSKNTSQKSDQKVVALGLVKRKRDQVRKPVARQGRGGRLLGTKRRTKRQVVEDFWKRVNVGGKDECWEWIGGKHGRPPHHHYGIMWAGGRRYKTHRFSYELHFGKLKHGLNACHKCDNPPCCNPNHLFAGTDKDNAQDCLRKGRANRERGEDRYNATLTERDIKEIRKRYKFRHPKNGGKPLSIEFGVGRTMISSIVNHLRWKHVKACE